MEWFVKPEDIQVFLRQGLFNFQNREFQFSPTGYFIF